MLCVTACVVVQQRAPLLKVASGECATVAAGLRCLTQVAPLRGLRGLHAAVRTKALPQQLGLLCCRLPLAIVACSARVERPRRLGPPRPLHNLAVPPIARRKETVPARRRRLLCRLRTVRFGAVLARLLGIAALRARRRSGLAIVCQRPTYRAVHMYISHKRRAFQRRCDHPRVRVRRHDHEVSIVRRG